MAQVNIPGVGLVQFADSLSDDEILTRARAMRDEASKPLLDPRDLGAGQLLKGGFSRGLEGLKGTAFDLIPALGASLIGKDEYAKGQLQEYRDRMAAEEAINPTAFKSYKDIGGVGDAFSFAAETLGEVGSDVASFMLGAGVGTVAGKTIAKKSLDKAIAAQAAETAAKQGLTKEAADELKNRLSARAIQGAVGQKATEVGANVGLQTGLWGTSLGVNIPDVFNSVYENTGSLEPGIALTIGSLVGALDTYLPSKILKQLGPKGKERIAAEMLNKSELVPVNFKRAFAGQVLGTASGEALTEGAQEALTLVGSQLAGDKDPFFSQENIDNIITSSLKGFIGGGTLGAPGGALEAKRMKDERGRQIGQREILQQQEAERLRLEQEQQAQQELAVQQQATGDLFGQPIPQGPGIPSTTVAEREAVANPIGATINDLAQQLLAAKTPEEAALIQEKLKRIEDSLPAQSYERQMILDLLGPALGYTPGISSARTQSIDTSPITVDQQGVARTAEQAEAERTAIQNVEGYQPDLFPQELGLAQAQERAQGLPPTIDQALAGPPSEALASRDFTTSGLTPDVAAAEFKTVLDADSLKGTGLTPQSGFYKKLLNKDLSDPADQAAVRDILVQVRTNPNLSNSTKQAVESLALQAFGALGQQTSVVGPRGGIRRDVNYGRIQPGSPVSEADRESVQVPSESVREESTAGTGELGQEGVVPTGGTTSELGDGKTIQSGTLEEQINESKAELAASQVEGKSSTTEGTPTGTLEGTNKVASVARDKPAAKATPTEKVAPKATPKATKRVLTRQEREFLEDQVLNLRADYSLAKDPETKAAIKAEIDATERDLKQGKAQVGEGAGMFRGDVSKLAKDLRAALNKMGLGGVGLRLEKALTTAEGTSAQGMYANKVIEVALNANDPTYTLNHEALHAMKEMGFFSNADWNILSNMARNTWMKQYGIEAKYPDLSRESQIEEAIAEAFATFQQQSPQTQSILTKAVNALRRLGNFLRGYGYQVSEDILGKAASGRLAKDRANIIEEFNNYLDTIPNSEVKYQVAAQKEIFTGVDKVIRATPKLSDTQKAAISEGVKVASDTGEAAILSLLPMHALGEVADPVFPLKNEDTPGLGSRFNRLINQRSGYQDTLNRGIDSVITEAKRAIKARPEQHKAFDTLVNTSTVEEVDPTNPRSKYENDPEKLAAYDKLVKEYNKLDKVWKDLYATMRNGYKQMYEEIKKAITTRIDDTDLDADTKKSVKNSILLKLAEQGMIEPYFGLGREGSYWLAADYKDKSGQQQTTVEAFKSEYERKVRIEQLNAMGATRIEPYASIANVDYRRAPSGSFVNSVLNILETNKPKDDVAAKRFDTAIDEMMRLFLTTLPETAFAQSFQKRKGTAGYMEDTIGVFERKMRNSAHQVANMVYSPKLTDVIDTMEKYTTQVGKGLEKGKVDAYGKIATEDVPSRDNKEQAKYLAEFRKHLGYVLSPTKNDIGSILTSAAFTYTLGFNVSSALVNMANIPMIVAPYLKGKYGDASVASAIGEATKTFTGSGTKTNMPVIGADGRTTAMRVMPSITNYAPDSEMGKRYATLIRIGNEQGQFNRSQLYEILNADTRTGIMAKFNAISGWMFHHGERMNREVTLVSAYNLELDRLKKQGVTGPEAEAQAAQTAIYTTELTNGGISAAAAPRIAQNSIGKVFFMYKRYGISMYYMMFKTAKEALKGETKEVREAAMKQLGGIVGMSALMAGAQGIPMFGALSLVYSLFTDEDEDDLDAVTQKALGDFLYKGPVEYLTNLSIAGRITLNDLIIRDAPQSNASTFTQQVIQAIGGPVFGVVDRVSRGYSKINEGNFERGIEDLLPSAASNAFKAVRYGSEGTKTLRGDPITGEVSMFNLVGQALGFAPADYTRQVEINAREKGIDKAISTQASKQKQKYYMAKREGDVEGMEEAREKLLEIGAKHPGLEITPGNVNNVLNRSIKAQERATNDMINGARYNKKRLEEIKASLAEYED
jgi:hypothetical protein